MEPVGYLQVVKRWWWLIAGLVAAALVITYLVSPVRIVDDYQATHVILVEAPPTATEGSVTNPEVVALWARERAVIERAAASIGPSVDPDRLRRDVSVRANPNVGSVSITATDRNADRAVLKANAVAQATVGFLTDRAAAEREIEQAALDRREVALRDRIDELETQIAFNPVDIATQTAERDSLIRQLGEVLDDQDAAAATVQYTTIDEAERATKEDRLPGTGSRTGRMALAALVAVVLGFGLALLLDRADTRVRTRRDAELHTGLPVIAEVVKQPFWTGRRTQALVRRPDTAAAESYRSMRSALMLLERDDAARTEDSESTDGAEVDDRRGHAVMISSPGSGDGKSTTVANLAAAYAESGRSVLVLSLDVQRRTRRRRRREAGRQGVADFLAADPPVPLAPLLHPTDVADVRQVAAGAAARPPGGQLEAEQRLIDEARDLADVVIVDTAPLLASSINQEMATMVDAVVALCRVGRTTTAQAERFGDLLSRIGAPAVGVALVGTTAPEGSEYFAYFTLRRDRRDVEPVAVPAGVGGATDDDTPVAPVGP